MRHKFLESVFIVTLTFCILSLSGCATSSLVGPGQSINMPGSYHRVEKGQTLWRISKMYNVDLDEIIRLNSISDITNIEVGQQIFIPSPQNIRPIYTQLHSEDFIWPIKGRIVLNFGEDSGGVANKGINIAPYRDKKIVASRSGKVVFCAHNFAGYGKTVIIDHGDGFLTVYAKNSQILIKAGDSVQQGSVIARTDSTDTDIYFEIRKGHIPQNPYFYLPR